MRTNDSRYLQPVLAEIANADPVTFQRMQNAKNWYVGVIDGPEDFMPLVKIDPDAGYAVMNNMGHANGLTIVARPDAPDYIKRLDGYTWLNRPYIKAEAASYDVSPVKYAADILVHEFSHREDRTQEPEAYDAGIEFAKKMGEPAIVAAQQSTKREVQRREDMARLLDDMPVQRGQLDGALGELLRLIEEGTR
jgi:hypothetical protein